MRCIAPSDDDLSVSSDSEFQTRHCPDDRTNDCREIWKEKSRRRHQEEETKKEETKKEETKKEETKEEETKEEETKKEEMQQQQDVVAPRNRPAAADPSLLFSLPIWMKSDT